MSVQQRITNSKVTDGFKNIHKSIGSSHDVTTNTAFRRNPYLSLNYYTTNSLYSNSLAGKAVDIPTEDAFRGGREFECEDTEKLEEYQEFLVDIKLEEKLQNLMKWGKVFGSAVAIIISDDDEMGEPLIVENLKQGDIKDIVILDRWQLYTMDINRNPLSSKFLEPHYYNVTRASTPIHHSRVIKLDGLSTTIYDKEVMNGWGLSIYERLYKELMNAQLSPDLLINLLVQSNLDVFHIDNLNDSIADGNDSFAISRLQTIMDGKSIYNGFALDKEDDYSNISKSFAGLGEVHDKFIELLCSSADIPKTRFMGEQSAGLANDGSGDMKIYYDRIESRERATLRTIYNILDPILTKSYFGETLDLKYKFASLFQMTDEQKSIIQNRDAQTKQIYLNSNVITEYEAKASLIDNPLFPTITAESLEEEKELYSEMDNINQGTEND